MITSLANLHKAGGFCFDNHGSREHSVPRHQYLKGAADSQEWVNKFISTLGKEDRAEVLKYEPRGDGSFSGYETLSEMSKDDRVIGKKQSRAWHMPNAAEFVEKRTNMARDMIRKMGHEQHNGGTFSKAGVTTTLGFNFYDLRGPAYLLYPVNTPFRNTMARTGRVNDGYGTAANWKATTLGPGSSYTGANEGQRVAYSTPNEVNYVATYKGHGTEREVSFEAQWAGEGYTDNLADEHLRGLQELWLGEEAQILFGNAGTSSGNNGFQLGAANTPVAALVTATGLIPDATHVSCFVVELTAMGYPVNSQFGYNTAPTVTGGLVPSYVRTNADGSQNTINGGIGAMSAASNVVTTDSTHEQVKFTVAAKNGAFAWAWYVNVTDSSAPSLANAKLAGITTIPVFVYNQATQAGTQLANATGLNIDHSAGTYDFDGLLTYGASTTGALFTNMYNSGGDGNLTPEVGGAIVQIDADLLYFWQQFQAQPNNIWASADAAALIDQAVLTAASSTSPSAYRFNIMPAGQDGIMAGFVVSAYKSRYSMSVNGGQAIPIRIHPMLPAGTIYYDVNENPYPTSRIPSVRELFVRRDYYSIEWPLVTRTWTFGTYVDEVLAHHLPFLCGVRTGITGVGS